MKSKGPDSAWFVVVDTQTVSSLALASAIVVVFSFRPIAPALATAVFLPAPTAMKGSAAAIVRAVAVSKSTADVLVVVASVVLPPSRVTPIAIAPPVAALAWVCVMFAKSLAVIVGAESVLLARV